MRMRADLVAVLTVIALSSSGPVLGGEAAGGGAATGDWLSTLIWAVGLLLALTLLRPVITQLTERAETISFKDWSIGLAPRQTALDSSELMKMMAQDAGDSGSQTIQQMVTQVTASRSVDYLVVDLGGGDSWWLSRLYLLARLVSADIRWLVFVETRRHRREFVTAMSPAALTAATDDADEFFRLKFSEAETASGNVFPGATLKESGRLASLIQSYVVSLAGPPMPADPTPDFLESHQPLKTGSTEVTRLVDGDFVYGIARFDEHSVRLPRGATEEEMSRMILDAAGGTVAVIDDRDTFLCLVDRTAMLEGVWTNYRKVLPG